MKTIYAVVTQNFEDTLYYETAEDADGFVKDQHDMGYWAYSLGSREVTDEQFDHYMSTMEQLDPTVVKFLEEQAYNDMMQETQADIAYGPALGEYVSFSDEEINESDY